MALCRRQSKPLVGFNNRLCHISRTSLEAGSTTSRAQIVLCGGMSLLRGPKNPLAGFDIVPNPTASGRQHHPQVELGRRMILAGSPAIPRNGLTLFSRVSPSLVEPLPETELRVGVSVIRLGLPAFNLRCRTPMKQVSIPRLIHNWTVRCFPVNTRPAFVRGRVELVVRWAIQPCATLRPSHARSPAIA